MGRFAIQLMGFFFMTVFMFALAIPYHHWTQHENRIGFVVMYSLTFFFANFGPNSTTFVVPAEIFPARLRSTCHGISAAAGKSWRHRRGLRVPLRFSKHKPEKDRRRLSYRYRNQVHPHHFWVWSMH
ncbi:putative ABC-type phosphate transporter [Helianthus annuus]|nr:putative ABC-type phosphate transporter [Helianthus annuus]